MNAERRILIREITAQFEQINERLRKIWNEEEEQYESRSSASKETVEGLASFEAIDDLERASDSIEEGCEILRGIVASGSEQ
jgi:hypothetical protein